MASQWIDGIAIVDFDVDHGHKLVHSVGYIPPQQHDVDAICFRALPDGSSAMGDTLFCFRLNKELCGFVNFRQQRDNARKRGFLQQSVVVLTHVWLPSLMKGITHMVAQSFFSQGPSALSDIILPHTLTWPSPPPTPSCALTTTANDNNSKSQEQPQIPIKPPPPDIVLECWGAHSLNGWVGGVGGPVGISQPRHCIVTLKPAEESAQVSAQRMRFDEGRLSVFWDKLASLWEIWELVITNQQIVCYARSADLVSDGVLAVSRLVGPLADFLDTQPYFTMNDITSSSRPTSESTTTTESTANSIPLLDTSSQICVLPAVLGVTNPYFLQIAQNVLHVPPSPCGDDVSCAIAAGHSPRETDAENQTRLSSSTLCLLASVGMNLSALRKRVRNESEETTDTDEQKRDRLDAHLLLHFEQLTTAFLQPIEEALAKHKQISRSQLLKLVPSTAGLLSPLFPWVASLQKLYLSFFRTPLFSSWVASFGVNLLEDDSSPRFWWGGRTDAPDGMADGFASGAKHLITEVAGGISGIVLRPIERAQGSENVVGGTVVGFGEGVWGLVSRPVKGVVGFTTDVVGGTVVASAKASDTMIEAMTPRNRKN